MRAIASFVLMLAVGADVLVACAATKQRTDPGRDRSAPDASRPVLDASHPALDAAAPRLDAANPSVDVEVHVGDACSPARLRAFDASLAIGEVYCSTASGFPDGYVTALCASDRDCPDDARCVLDVAPFDRGSCVKPCMHDYECAAPASCRGTGVFGPVSYCFVDGGSAGRSERAIGATDDCAPACSRAVTCCDGACFDLGNDQFNCGACGHVCPESTPFCGSGRCLASPCSGCAAAETCCNAGGPMGPQPTCLALAEGEHCPLACYDCMCAAPDTPIATPSGERRIADLSAGDLVYSVSDDAIVVVPIARVNRTAVVNHTVIRVALANGRVLEMSAGHPLVDGRTFADLTSAGLFDGERVLEVARVPYAHPFTYDILPASTSGTYFAAGVRVGSTLAEQHATDEVAAEHGASSKAFAGGVGHATGVGP